MNAKENEIRLMKKARDGMNALIELCEDKDTNCKKCPLSRFKCPGAQAMHECWADEIEGALIEAGAYEEKP